MAEWKQRAGSRRPGGAVGGSPATESRPLFKGEHVVVVRRGAYLNAYVPRGTEAGPVEAAVLAVKELIDRRQEIAERGGDTPIWLSGPGFRIGVTLKGRVWVAPTRDRKAIPLADVVEFVKTAEAHGLKFEGGNGAR